MNQDACSLDAMMMMMMMMMPPNANQPMTIKMLMMLLDVPSLMARQVFHCNVKLPLVAMAM